MIASEPLTFEKGNCFATPVPYRASNELFSADWMEIKTNMLVTITPKMNVLQSPIIDEFWVPPSDPAAKQRGVDLAVAKGLLPNRDARPPPAMPTPPAVAVKLPQPVAVA